MLIERVSILGVNINNITIEQAVEKSKDFFDGGVHAVFTPNPEIIMKAQKDSDFKNILNSADMTIADGVGVIIASKILKKPLAQRITGFDFVSRLFDSGRTFYLFGSKPGVADAAADNLRAKGINVVGAHHGYFDDDSEIIDDINRKKPDILLVCLGAPKQEKWINTNSHKINAGLCVGVGSTLDIIAGNVPRAPMFTQKMGIEWLYRAIIEPSRIPRLVAIPKFIFAILIERISKKA